jgi:hypothetical protein
MEDYILLSSLNNSPLYDHSITLNNIVYSNDDTHFTNSNIYSQYYDINRLIHSYSDFNTPLILSINIQSLQIKFNDLLELINNLTNYKIIIDVNALQET